MVQDPLVGLVSLVALGVALSLAARRREAAPPLPLALALVLPVSALTRFVCAASPRLHRSLSPLAAFTVAVGLTKLAPEPFLSWWWG